MPTGLPVSQSFTGNWPRYCNAATVLVAIAQVAFPVAIEVAVARIALTIFVPVQLDVYPGVSPPTSVSGDKTARKTLHERFFTEVRQYMKPGARIYAQTSALENFASIYDMLERHRFRIMEMHSE